MNHTNIKEMLGWVNAQQRLLSDILTGMNQGIPVPSYPLRNTASFITPMSLAAYSARTPAPGFFLARGGTSATGTSAAGSSAAKPIAAASEKQEKKTGLSLPELSAFSSASLTQEDLHTLVGLYGNRIENIYELGAGQKWMLDEAKRVPSAFFLQFLMKAVISLDTALFRQQADKVCEKHESLRSAFVYRDVSHPYRVVLKDRHPEVNYIDLSHLSMDEFNGKIEKLMAADRQRGFDLGRDSLLRINIYKSCEKDTYAIILSQPHINSDGISVGLLFGDLFVGYALDLNGIDKKIEAQSYEEYASHLRSINVEKELSYWKDTLKDAKEDQMLPGQRISSLDYASASYFLPFTENELSLLKKAQKTFRVTEFTLFQGLWGVMAAQLKKTDSIVFGAITSGRDAGVSDSMTQTGGFINVLPVNIQIDKSRTFADFLHDIQKSFASSMQNSHCSPGQIEEALGRKTPLFSHILNSHSFISSEGSGFGGMGIPGIRLLGGDSYDNLSADLCVYFTGAGGQKGILFSYNERAFLPGIIRLYAGYFKEMLHGLEELDPDMTPAHFPVLDVQLLHDVEELYAQENLSIAGFLKKHPVFKGVPDDALLALAGKSRVEQFPEDGMICREAEQSEDVCILAEGQAYLLGRNRSGWSNPVQILKKKDLFCLEALSEGMRVQNHVLANRDGTRILMIPAGELRALSAEYPQVMTAILSQLIHDRNRYLTLWNNVD